MLAAAVCLPALAAGAVLVTSGAKQPALAAQPSPVHTAQVEQRTLSAMVSQPGTLTFRARPEGLPYLVINQAQGTYTRLPAVGQVISQGGVLFRVNDCPVVLLYGSTPAYRPVLDTHGWGGLQEELNTLSKQGKWVEMGDLIDDEILNTFAVVGEPESIGPELHTRYGDVIQRISFYAPYKSDPERWRAVLAAVKAA